MDRAAQLDEKGEHADAAQVRTMALRDYTPTEPMKASVERLNGAMATLKSGDTVTFKDRPGNALTIIKIRNWSLSGDARYHCTYKGQSGEVGEVAIEKLVLTSHSELQALAQLESIREMVAALTAAVESKTLSGNEHADAIEKAQQAIQEDPLSVEVRSRWMELRDWGNKEQVAPAEFKILLCTGGPAVQIIGELNAGEPEKPRLQHQDWGTPWTDVRLSAEDEETLLAYCREFYFGE